MATIQELEQKIQQLEKQILAKDLKDRELIDKSEKAIEFAKHAYKVDHYGFIWVWDINKQDYRKTNMRVCTPEIADKALESRNIADNAIEGRHLQDKVVEGRMIKNKTIDGRSIKNDSIGGEQIKDESITGDSLKPGGVDKGKLADDAVSERNLQNHSVTKDKLSTDLISLIYSAGAHGYHLSDTFGSNDDIGINQKALTLALNKIWSKLEDITGEVYTGFNMVVTPEYFIGEDGCKLTITASSENTAGIFEKLAFFWNSEQEPFFFAENIPGIDAMEVDVPEDKVINDKVIIRCEAQILGMPYVEQKAVTHYDSFFLGAGNDYHDLMISDEWNPEYAISARHHMRGAHDVEVGDGEHIIIVLGDSLASGFIRADINGVEIAFDETSVVVDEKIYKVLTSENTYQEGTYNIDING